MGGTGTGWDWREVEGREVKGKWRGGELRWNGRGGVGWSSILFYYIGSGWVGEWGGVPWEKVKDVGACVAVVGWEGVGWDGME